MNTEVIETVSNYRRALKAYVKGVIKSKTFGGENGDFVFNYATEYDKKLKLGSAIVEISNDYFTMKFVADVSTRVVNKINNELFAPIVTQFEKLKSVSSMKFEEGSCECCNCEA